MGNPFFDTLAYAKRLMEVGFTKKQAEGQAEAMAQLVGSELMTKRDIKKVELDINRLEANMDRIEKELIIVEKRLTDRLTLRMGAMLTVAVSVLATLLKIH
ncbi:MAG TPA: hypothetical protein VJB02_05355 [Coxiellaceae bacterium]|nr:hypothetical protein [Coxiellaceae bacterium]